MKYQAHINLFKQRVRKRISTILAPLARIWYQKNYRSVAPIDKRIMIDPKNVYGWYGGNRYDQVTFLGQIQGGEWKNRITTADKVFKNTIKVSSVVDRYENGKKWRETILFKKIYRKSYKEGKNIHGIDNLTDLEKFYNERYDSIFESVKKNGLLPSSDSNPGIDPIYIYIHKNGELLYTENGNHRLGMCKVLGICRMPVLVWKRHVDWQKKRDIILSGKESNERDELLRKYSEHPDIITELGDVASAKKQVAQADPAPEVSELVEPLSEEKAYLR